MANKKLHGDFVLNAFLPHLRSVRINSRILESSFSFNALHDLRVHARRLRNLIWVFRNIFPRESRRKISYPIAVMARRCSFARDVDVNISFLTRYRSKLSSEKERGQIDSLILTLKAQRKKLQPLMVKAIKAFRAKNVLKQIEKKLRQYSLGHKGIHEAELGRIVQKRMVKRLERFLYYERYVSSSKRIEELHAMRIEAKHLRYTLEFMRPFFSRKIDSHIAIVLRFHRRLGEIHDYDVRISELQKRLLNIKKGTPLGKTLKNLENYCKKKRRSAYQKFRKEWSWSKKTFRWEALRNYVNEYR